MHIENIKGIAEANKYLEENKYRKSWILNLVDYYYSSFPEHPNKYYNLKMAIDSFNNRPMKK